VANYDEKRQYKRVPDAFIVTFQLKSPRAIVLQAGNQEYDAIALDVSEGGVGVDSGQEIPVGAEVLMRFRILNELSVSDNDRRREIVVEGESRYCRSTDPTNYRVGLLFKNLTEDDRAFLARYVKDQLLGKY